MKSIHALAGALAAVSAVGCAFGASSAPPPAAMAVDTVVRVDTVRVETAGADPALADRVAQLQLQVIEKDVQLSGLQEQLDGTRLELVRNMARLQTQASRAEAASGMSEAEIALSALRRAPGGAELPELTEAQTLFDQSSAAFAEENYGGALYLATQVRALARSGQGRLRSGGGTLRSGESLFALPVPLQTTGRSNVRSGPGLDFDVLFTLDPSEPLVGQSYTSQWVRIVDDQGREGWIFHTLVTSR